MNRKSFLKTIFFAGGALLISGSVYAMRSIDLQISREQVPVKGLKQNIRIAALSDFHAPCHYLSTENLISTINAEKPDVLIIAGDMFGTRNFQTVIHKFKEANASCAKLAVMGNWEYWLNFDPESLKKTYANSDIKLLINESCEVRGLKIIGLDDLLKGTPNFEMADIAAGGSSPMVVVSHCPAGFDHLNSDDKNQKIVISGHTHGGQIAPFGRALMTPNGSGRYVKGWYRRGNNSMYVMRGVGATYLPFRIGARPELLVLDLIPA